MARTQTGNQRGPAHLAMARRQVKNRLGRDSLREFKKIFKRCWRQYLSGLERSQKCFSKDRVHESRVRTRRLLALLELLSAFLPPTCLNELRCGLKHHLDSFDELRDTQVQLGLVTGMCGRFPEAEPFLEYLKKRRERLSRKTHSALRKIKTHRLGKTVEQIRRELKRARRGLSEDEVDRKLLTSLRQAFEATVHLRRLIKPEDTATIHRTRIAFKRFRYMMEELEPWLSGRTGKLLDALHAYQTRMGDVQDAEVLLCRFDKFTSKKKCGSKRAKASRLALVKRRQRLVLEYLRSADELLSFWPFDQNSTLSVALSSHAAGREPLPSGNGEPRVSSEQKRGV